jgi:hypothetical protein
VSVDCDDGGEPIVVDSQRQRRARKEHRCDACKETVERGHIYVRHTVIWGGQVEETVRCLRCDAIYQHLCEIHRTNNEANRRRARETHFGDYDTDWPDIALNCGHEFKERWGREPPEELARLAFLTPAEMQAEALAKLGAKL